jgi:pimeloyl-ACP methyl ester carboxylesterase
VRRHPVPHPPIELPPARTVNVPGSGELFFRDTGGPGPVVLLLHGWMASADLNWWPVYGDLADAGYRVLALDQRGHGRGPRALNPFRIADCAADAAGLLRTVHPGPALIVGYSMGGAIAQLMGHVHPDVVAGLVLSGTAQHWKDRRSRTAFRAMGAVGLLLSLAPRTAWSSGMRALRVPQDPLLVWFRSELLRHSARDIAEAGRELGRFDSRPWLGSIQAPVAVLVSTRDELVPASRQRALAAAAGAEVFESPISHLEVGWRGADYNGALIRALRSVQARGADRAGTEAPADERSQAA